MPDEVFSLERDCDDVYSPEGRIVPMRTAVQRNTERIPYVS